MNWCFAIVNNKLAEIFYDKKKDKAHIWGHCYVKEEEYKTKQEKKCIKQETRKLRFAYRNKKYRQVEIKQKTKS